MPRSRKVSIVNGLATVRAIRRAGGQEESEVRPAPAAAAPPGGVIGSRIGRTVLPEQREHVCYSCGYAFKTAGLVRQIVCPKCRLALDTSDYTLEGAAWAEDMRTLGTVRIPPEATVAGGAIVATEVVVEGGLAGGEVTASKAVTVRAGARVDFARLKTGRLVIAEGASFVLEGELCFRSLDVRGALEANVRASERVSVGPAGSLRGMVRAPRLVVEDGAEVQAELWIGAEPTAAAAAPPAAEGGQPETK